jgi:hypothetical protein
MRRGTRVYCCVALSAALALCAIVGTGLALADQANAIDDRAPDALLGGTNLCDGFVQPGCIQSGCLEGFTCDTSVGCVPSACACDPETGGVVCTTDCGGGTCVPTAASTCCDPANEPGTGGNPVCFEGASCCSNGAWMCNGGAGNSTCIELGEVCTACCDPADEPGRGNNPPCIEGTSCCSTGAWACNGAAGTPSCSVLGLVCTDDLCAGFEAPGCIQSGCLQGQSCDTSVGCVPSACVCDSATGAIICTDDCGGGICVPEPSGDLLGACALSTLALLTRRRRRL